MEWHLLDIFLGFIGTESERFTLKIRNFLIEYFLLNQWHSDVFMKLMKKKVKETKIPFIQDIDNIFFDLT